MFRASLFVRVGSALSVLAAFACSNGKGDDGVRTGGAGGSAGAMAASGGSALGGSAGLGLGGASAGTAAVGQAGAGGSAGAAIAGAGSGTNPDDALVWPESIEVMGLPGGHGSLEMFALTVRKGASYTEMYAALRNVGDRPVCDGALTIELYDKDGMSVAAGIGGLLTEHLYRLTDGSGSIAACVGAGEVTMASMLDLPPTLDLDNLGYAVYRNPYFGIPVDLIGTLSVSDIVPVTTDAGTSCTGTLRNGIDVAVANPTVMLFPVNRVGRPLGMMSGSGTVELAPGDTWSFQTSSDVVGVDYAAYVTGTTSKPGEGGQGGDGGQAGQSGQGGQAGN